MSVDECTKTLVTRRVTWNPEETKILISLVGKHSTQNGKLTNAETYQQVSEQMLRLGHKKTPDQCKIKWKHLKNFYYEARKKKTDHERYTICPFYKEIRAAVGSPTTSILNSRRANSKPVKVTSKQRQVRTEKCFPNTVHESHQQNGKFNEPIATTCSSSSIETAKFTIRNPHHITSSVTVSPCSPADHEKCQELNLPIRSKSFTKCQVSDTEKGHVHRKASGVLQQNEHDNFSYFLSSATSTIPTNLTNPITQPYQDNNLINRETPSPTFSSNSSRTNSFTYSPEVCIKWNSYQINMQNTLPQLLDGDKFVDVTLACEGKFLKCHKLILSACSIYFDELLSQATSQYPIIFMKDMKFWQVQAIVEFMYRGEVNIAQERLSSLLAAAEALRVKGLAAPSNHTSNLIDSPKLYSAVRRNRKRKYRSTNEASENKTNNENQEKVDTTKTNRDKNVSPAKNQCSGSDEEPHFFKTDQFILDKDTEAESSCVTTIILPDHNYQQNTLCKLPEYNHDQYETKFAKSSHCENEQDKNNHDHLYSKPQKIKNQLYNQTELGENEMDVNIHDNTIFYSYLSIYDSESSKID